MYFSYEWVCPAQRSKRQGSHHVDAPWCSHCFSLFLAFSASPQRLTHPLPSQSNTSHSIRSRRLSCSSRRKSISPCLPPPQVRNREVAFEPVSSLRSRTQTHAACTPFLSLPSLFSNGFEKLVTMHGWSHNHSISPPLCWGAFPGIEQYRVASMDMDSETGMMRPSFTRRHDTLQHQHSPPGQVACLCRIGEAGTASDM